MPRIPDADVARLKQMVPLTDLAAAAGVTLVGQGHSPQIKGQAFSLLMGEGVWGYFSW